MKHRFAAVAVAGALVVSACGGNDTSPEEARRVIIAALVNDAALPRDVAECVADGALAKHAPDELVNTSGTTTDAVNASVQIITTACITQLTPTTTTAPPTTVAATTVPTTEPVELNSYCAAMYDVAVGLAASAKLVEPGPASTRAWFDEVDDRLEIAVLSAPAPRFQDLPLDLKSRLDAFEKLVAQAGYDIEGVERDPNVETVTGRIDALSDEVTAFLGESCDRTVDGDGADVTSLADDLAALDVPTTTTPTTVPTATTVPPDPVPVEHLGSGITLSVPPDWTQEEGGVAPTNYGPETRYLIRAVDLARFKDGGMNGEGVGVFAVDGTTDFARFLDGSQPSQDCTLDDEQDYDDGVYAGTYQLYGQCGGSTGAVIVVGAADADKNIALYLEIRVPSAGDWAIDTVLDTFFV